MIITSTLELDLTGILQSSESETKQGLAFNPSSGTIAAILSYSKNLEIKKSRLLKDIEIMKS